MIKYSENLKLHCTMYYYMARGTNRPTIEQEHIKYYCFNFIFFCIWFFCIVFLVATSTTTLCTIYYTRERSLSIIEHPMPIPSYLQLEALKISQRSLLSKRHWTCHVGRSIPFNLPTNIERQLCYQSSQETTKLSYIVTCQAHPVLVKKANQMWGSFLF